MSSIIFINMKKVKSVILIYLFLTIISFAGTAQNLFKASLSMGTVIPIGNFSSTNETSTQSGYAQNGFMLNIDGDYYLHHRLAISLRFLFENSPIDKTEFSKWMNNDLSGYIKNTDTIKYDISYWQFASPMIGIKYNYPISINKLYFEVGAFTGISIVQIPDQNLYFNDTKNKRVIVSQNVGNTDVTMPLALNAGIRYRINPQMEFKLLAEYFYTKTSYEHLSYLQNNGSTEQILIENKKYTWDIPVQTINISAGLVYNF
jgi:hypothetical protein